MTSTDDESLYAEMRAAIRGDRERAEKRAAQKQPDAPATPQPPVTEEPPRAGGVRRLFGSRRRPS